ncbi:OmpA family protein [Vibrio sp. MEBiC08052]|uniref:OmpA family protein n=1 Tax=Vibrio sp. MEBiC08052 TaxID=1761910 RepID=UPI0007407EE4|nr:OmpA family protein [Vibrio sp. MEBiC08052]KUI98417.1 outer membrane protein A precursor [Vibrio sp. MEBiC08052]
MNKMLMVVSVTSWMVSAMIHAEVYVGGKVGQSWLDDGCRPTDVCDDDSSAVGAFLGYQVWDHVALEAGYDYLGKFTGAGMVNDHVNAVTIAPKFDFPLYKNLDLYAKLGGAYVDYGSKDDWSYLAAAGLELNATDNVAVRLEYQTLTDMNNDIVRAEGNMATLGVTYRFGHSESTPVTTSEPRPTIVEPAVVEEAPEPVPAESADTPVIKTVKKSLSSESSFALNSAVLNKQGVADLQEAVELMSRHSQATATVTGYTDSTGSKEYNQSLSLKRAQAVAEQLVSQGIDADRITVRGMGESAPVASNDTKEGRAKNRRVEVEIPIFTYQVVIKE